ncbi:hypothetical protein EN850_13240 [Mesorhizobium sp. M8A.F.Ca.ET.207.01.1.1]|uniref:restriction endonuclease n=1 Tax=Mesorhizobium sp. M8A.F.Ca.ET.207.01.1.1 TaxID=2563968 RepID=UPI00109D7722|nr:restriction endonuclease [Mesorhizobium sp. M8A.F.Ca.ET.207.01.1.1]TGQ80242.1 hypothetical protein EN850_13240 [Mesorhizobium sp. M8A.F.Ca.ET.207.01.1.1]
MPLLDAPTMQGHLAIALDQDATTSQRGKALEDLVAYVFGQVPGIAVTHRNEMNVFDTEEIDVAIFNDGAPDGFHYLPSVILIECKNWSSAVSSIEVSWFINKLRSRGLDFGVLVATNGITGNVAELTNSHNLVAAALLERRKLIVLTTAEIAALVDTDQLSTLVKRKLCELAIKGSIA